MRSTHLQLWRCKGIPIVLWQHMPTLVFKCFSNFNDYLMPILSTSDFLNFLNASKNIFPEQWVFFIVTLQYHSRLRRQRLDWVQRAAGFYFTFDSSMNGEPQMPPALVSNTLHRYVWLGYERYIESPNIISGNCSVPKLSGQVLHVAHGGYRSNCHQATIKRTQLFDGAWQFSTRQSAARPKRWEFK